MCYRLGRIFTRTTYSAQTPRVSHVRRDMTEGAVLQQMRAYGPSDLRCRQFLSVSRREQRRNWSSRCRLKRRSLLVTTRQSATTSRTGCGRSCARMRQILLRRYCVIQAMNNIVDVCVCVTCASSSLSIHAILTRIVLFREVFKHKSGESWSPVCVNREEEAQILDNPSSPCASSAPSGLEANLWPHHFHRQAR